MRLTEEHIKALMPGNDDWRDWVDPIHDLFGKYGVQSKERIAMFIAQCGHREPRLPHHGREPELFC